MREEYRKLGKNFMTPDIINYDFVGSKVVEISQGTGMSGKKIFGVTEMEFSEGKFSPTGNSEMFYSLKEAQKHYKKLVTSI